MKLLFFTRSFLLVIFFLYSVNALCQVDTHKITVSKYELIAKNGKNYRSIDQIGKINYGIIKKLPESVFALAALYSGYAGSECIKDSCRLTASLGLGEQGSVKQRELIQKWFKKDSLAARLIKNNFYQTPDGSSFYSNILYLCFQISGNIVTVNYTISFYDHGKYSYLQGPDTYKISDGQILTLKRHIK